MYVVQREQPQTEDLVGHDEVPDVRPGKPAAGGAGALAVQRRVVGAELRAFDVESPVRGERGAVASHPRRRDAVEEIDSARDTLEHGLGKAAPLEVAGRAARR